MNNLTPIFKFVLNEDLSDQFLPTRGTELATGWDVRSAQDLTLEYGQYAKIPLGFRVFIPPGWWLELKPRSSSFTKKSLHALYGVIDEDYFGQMIFACQYLPSNTDEKLEIKFGDAIGQLIPVVRHEMKVERINNEEYENLCKASKTTRGAGGFGSTGR